MKYVLNNRLFRMKLKEKGFRSAVEFAHKSGIHRNTINHYLKGKSVFASSFERIAEALACDPTELIAPVAESRTSIPGIEEILPIVGLINKHDKRIAVFLLGSRAKGKNRTHADWDIGFTRTPEPIASIEFLRLRGMVKDAAEDLVHGVDLINADLAPKWFLESIDYEPIFLSGDEQSFIYFKGVLDGAKRNNAA